MRSIQFKRLLWQSAQKRVKMYFKQTKKIEMQKAVIERNTEIARQHLNSRIEEKNVK